MTCSIPSMCKCRHRDLRSTGLFNGNIDHMEQPDKYTVVFYLKSLELALPLCLHRALGRRLHDAQAHFRSRRRIRWRLSSTRRSAWAPTRSRDSDPNGKWFLWERREDWQRTSVALLGEPSIRFAMYIDPGPSDKRVIAQTAHQLDVIHDIHPGSPNYTGALLARVQSAGSTRSRGLIWIRPCQQLFTTMKYRVWTSAKSAGR